MVQQDHLAKGGTVEEPEAFYLLELSCQVGGVCATHGGVQVPLGGVLLVDMVSMCHFNHLLCSFIFVMEHSSQLIISINYHPTIKCKW